MAIIELGIEAGIEDRTALAPQEMLGGMSVEVYQEVFDAVCLDSGLVVAQVQSSKCSWETTDDIGMAAQETQSVEDTKSPLFSGVVVGVYGLYAHLRRPEAPINEPSEVIHVGLDTQHKMTEYKSVNKQLPRLPTRSALPVKIIHNRFFST